MLTKKDYSWIEHATYDEDGFVNGVTDDAPDEVKQAYKKHQKENQKYIENGTMIPK